MFSLSEKFSLALRWEYVVYNLDGICELHNAYFSGPVLNLAQAVEPNDFIMLDFYSQYIHIVNGTFVAKFHWGEVKYVEDSKKILLKNAYITHDTELNRVPKLSSCDWLLIDTSNHTSDVHQTNFVYKTYVMKEDKNLHKFGKND